MFLWALKPRATMPLVAPSDGSDWRGQGPKDARGGGQCGLFADCMQGSLCRIHCPVVGRPNNGTGRGNAAKYPGQRSFSLAPAHGAILRAVLDRRRLCSYAQNFLSPTSIRSLIFRATWVVKTATYWSRPLPAEEGRGLLPGCWVLGAGRECSSEISEPAPAHAFERAIQLKAT